MSTDGINFDPVDFFGKYTYSLAYHPSEPDTFFVWAGFRKRYGSKLAWDPEFWDWEV